MKSSLFLIAASLGGLLLLTGCQTPGGGRVVDYPAPDARWETRSGQLRYATPERSVIGDVTVSRLGAEEFQLDFLTGPGVPLIRLRQSGEQMQAEGIFARGTWRGRSGRAGRLGSWANLREAFVAVEKEKSGASAPDRHPIWTAQREAMAPDKERITVEYPKSKERFIFVLPR